MEAVHGPHRAAALLSFALTSLPNSAQSTEPASAGVFSPQLVTVQTPTSTDKDRLETLGLDLTEHAGAGFVEVLLHTTDDADTLDASGLAGDEMVSAENRYMENRPSSFLMRQNTQAPLQMLAEQTGGLAAVNTNDWKDSLAELSKDFSNFYSIGYRTTRAAADRPHSVEVRSKRKGLRVRARKGLLEKSTETRTAEAVVEAVGSAAVELASRAVQLTRESNPAMLRTLAVALAENRRFDEAVAVTGRALRLAEASGRSELVSDLTRCLEIFKAGKSWRESRAP